MSDKVRIKRIKERIDKLTQEIKLFEDDIWPMEEQELRKELWDEYVNLRRANCALGMVFVRREAKERRSQEGERG